MSPHPSYRSEGLEAQVTQQLLQTLSLLTLRRVADGGENAAGLSPHTLRFPTSSPRRFRLGSHQWNLAGVPGSSGMVAGGLTRIQLVLYLSLGPVCTPPVPTFLSYLQGLLPVFFLLLCDLSVGGLELLSWPCSRSSLVRLSQTKQ